MNYGRMFGIIGAVWSLCAAVGYLCHRDYRQAVYFFFCFCIGLTVVY